MTPWEDSIPRLRLALWVGWHYYKRLAAEHVSDFRQTAALAALSTVDIANDTEAVRAIRRVFQQTMRHYGYMQVDGAGWIPDGRVPSSPPKHRCGAPNCRRAGVYLDKTLGRLCRHCREFVRHREAQADKYQQLLLRKPSTAGRVGMVCQQCQEYFTRQKCKRIRAGRTREFCSSDCYRAWRSSETVRGIAVSRITAHAIEQFMERVCNSMDTTAIVNEIRRGLTCPLTIKRKRHGWEIECKGLHEFRVRLARDSSNHFQAVTVLESRQKKQQQKAIRNMRRNRTVQL